MKLNYLFVFLMLVAVFVFTPVRKVVAQEGDTLTVEWLDGGGNFINKALETAIANDTARPDGRVYKLRKGGVYYITETITNNDYHLRIVGETPDPNDAEGGFPAILQLGPKDDGTYTGRMITGNSSVMLKNLYIIGADQSGVQGSYYQPIQMDASNSRFEIDHCVFERSNFAIVAWTAKNNDIFLTNNVYRNLVENPPTQIWAGRGVSVWADQDTIIVENNTFFNINFSAFQLESGAANYLRVNHNTFVNIGRGINTTPWLREAYFANNLIINAFWHGEAHNQNELDSPNRDPRQTFSGIFGFGALPSKYGPEAGRRILFANNTAYLDPYFVNFYADSIQRQWFVGPVLKEDFIDPYDQIVVNDTTWLTQRPDFPTYPDDIFDLMAQNVTGTRAGASEIPTYFWRLPMVDGSVCNTCPSWPLPEDFSYTTASLLTAGTDNLPLGDLNWFPAQLADFEANKDAYIQDMQDEAGGIVTYPVITTVEAESGTAGAGAAVEDYDGELPYFVMTTGSMEWKFNLPEAASVELSVWTKRFDDGNVTRGQRIKLNGNNIRNNSGYGEWFWDNNLPVDWGEFHITKADVITADDGTSNPAYLDLPAGENTLRIESSWGYQHFLKVEIFVGGVVVKTLDASNYSTLDVVTIVSPDPSIYVPSGFKSVNMGVNGTVTWAFDVPSDGEYALNLFYLAPNGPQTGQLTGGGQTVDLSFASESNSNLMTLLSGVVPLTAGTQSVTVTGSGINLDYVQLVQKVVSSVTKRPELPEGYKLSQNYPNPFNPSTKINFDLGNASNVKLTVYNLLGEKVATLVNTFMNAGAYTVDFNASNLSSGIYFYRLEAGNIRIDKKMMFIK